MKKPTKPIKPSKAASPPPPCEQGEDVPVSIATSITVLGVLQQGNGMSLVIAPKDASHDRAVLIPAGLLAQSSTGLLEKLLLERNLGVLLSQLDSKAISSQLRQFLTNPKLVVIDSVGHHKLSFGGIGYELLAHNGRHTWLGSPPSGLTVTLIGEAARTPQPEKSLDDLNKTFTPIISACERLMVTLLFALAALLVGRLGLPPLALLLVGRSSIGKSIVQSAVAWLVNGDGHVRMFNGTPKGMQKFLLSQPARAVFFDDSHGGDNAASAASLIMATGNGAEQRLTARAEDNSAATQIQASLVLSAEEDLASSMRRGGVPMHSGVGARVFEIHAGKYGVFDDLCGQPSSASLAHTIKAISPCYAGVIGAAFVAAMAERWNKLPTLWSKHQDGYRSAIKAAAGVEDLDGINGRLLDQLAVAAFAGEFAVRRNVLNLKTEQIFGALGKLFREHLDRQGVGKTPVAQAVIDTVRHFLQVNPSKFDPIEQAQSERARNGLAGYLKRGKDGELLYLFFPESFKQLLPEGTESEALPVLDESGFLAHQPSRRPHFQARFRPFGSSKEAPRLAMDFVAVRASILGAET